ncbi:MAG: hypothetical protein M0R51_04295, partial [Clostridia bacterium]|nr:hypothetical protein [Clostridia bacterium]
MKLVSLLFLTAINITKLQFCKNSSVWMFCFPPNISISCMTDAYSFITSKVVLARRCGAFALRRPLLSKNSL